MPMNGTPLTIRARSPTGKRHQDRSPPVNASGAAVRKLPARISGTNEKNANIAAVQTRPTTVAPPAGRVRRYVDQARPPHERNRHEQPALLPSG